MTYGSADWPRNSYNMNYSATPAGPGAPAPEPSGGSYLYGGQPPQKPKRRKGVNVLAVTLVALAACAVGGTILGLATQGHSGGGVVNVETDPTGQKGEPMDGSHGTGPVNTAGTKAPKKAAVPTIDDGTWHVGQDVPPGTYRVNKAVSHEDYCYWEKDTDAEGTDIISNANVTGGRPQVTLKKGQWFTTDGCGTWTKQ